MKIENWGLHWFRRDLRVPGNQALKENWKQTAGRTLGLFCFDSNFLSRTDFSNNRFAFFLKTLQRLRSDLRERGGDILVVDCSPQEAFPNLFHFCRSKGVPLPTLVTWNRDYEPFAIERDHKIKELLQSEGIQALDFRDHLVFEPHEVLKNEQSGGFYQIYSPFFRKWSSLLESAEGTQRIKLQAGANYYFSRHEQEKDLFKMTWSELRGYKDFPFVDSLERFINLNSKKVTVPIPEAGFNAAYTKVLEFKSQIDSYNDQRDCPAIKGTSGLSIFLKNGSLTTAQIIEALDLNSRTSKLQPGRNHFTKELAWREFYYSILFHRPEVEKHTFNPKFEGIKWANDRSAFRRWKEGRTGVPIVDAGMRQLSQTGWMHNRVRMIVASFLTKDLLIDWRWGENHFMKELLDGDLASNNGGWQWAASTGCDPQPYFRIFNPWLQGKKFDPDAAYIKTFVTELSDAPIEFIHEPTADRSKWHYPKPIIDHTIQRIRAIQLMSHSKHR